jgi:hypothetical protein
MPVRKLFVASLLTALAGSILAIACGSSDDAAGFNGVTQDGGSPDGAAVGDASPFGDAAKAIEANGIVLVHAAAFPAFRICFEGTPDDQPQPSTELMPESNLVGVDVGTAVRLAPRATLGKATVFPEAAIRATDPAGGNIGPTCNELLNSAAKDNSLEVGNVSEDLSRGVHVLVLLGCRGSALDPVASAARCGDDWEASKGTAKGNLQLGVISLQAYARPNATQLSVQIVQLSPGLQRRAAGRTLGLAFGPLAAIDSGTLPAPFIAGAVPFGEPIPKPPAVLDYAEADMSSYANSGLVVSLGDAIGDGGTANEGGVEAGARELVIAQSLADIQKRSSPRSLPRDWFAIASSYVVLSLGDPDPRLADGGRDDDERRALHLLAIPLAAPPSAGDAGL